MRNAIYLASFVVFAYVAAWGLTWATGDASTAVMVQTNVGTWTSYPGVFLGGLLPVPSSAFNLPIAAVACGLIALIGLLVVFVHGRRRPRSSN